MNTRPTATTTTRAMVCEVRTISGMTAGQACDPGLTDSTPTNAHSGRWRSHIAAGMTMATAPAIRARAQAWRDAPCQISATK